MNRSTQNILIAAILSIITILVAIIAIEFGTQSHTQTIDGVTYANTTEGMQELTDVEYIRGSFVNFKVAQPIMPKVTTEEKTELTPVMLPNTAAPHGEIVCTIESRGQVYTVRTDDSCDKFNV